MLRESIERFLSAGAERGDLREQRCEGIAEAAGKRGFLCLPAGAIEG